MTPIVDKEALRRHVERCVGDLPAMPDVVSRVIELTDSRTSTAAELEDVVSTDQALAAKVLRVVNSAFYGMNGSVTSIRHAVQILGMRQLRNLTLSLAAMSLVKARAPHMIEYQRDFWRHSLGVAVTAATVARRAGLSRDVSDDVFTGGLLHDIGRLFLLGYFFDLFKRTYEYSQTGHLIIHIAEQRLLGIDHCEIGMLMARHWDFPELLVTMIREHHGPVGRDEHFEWVACVHVADCIIDRIDGRASPEGSQPEPGTMEWAGLTPEDTEEILAEAREKLLHAEDLIGLSPAA